MLNQNQLTNCDKEPIHIAGSIQPVGFLLLIDPQDFTTLMQVGEVHDAFKESLLSCACPPVEDYLRDENQDKAFYTRVYSESKPYGVRLHKRDGKVVVEAIESISSWDSEYNILDHIYRIFDNPSNSSHLYQEVCAFVKELTDFERVMLYRFEKDAHGKVIGEAKLDELDSYLFHHFPASDIPVQARALYVKNRVRFIADVDHQPVPLDPEFSSLDMSDCILRAVSPVHIEYLKNMNVKSSMSISIVVNNQLWGLIACHDRRARTISVENLKLLQLSSLIYSREFLRLERESYDKERETLEKALNTVYKSAQLFMERSRTEEVIKLVLKKLNQLYDCDYAILKIGEELYSSAGMGRQLFKELHPYLESSDLYISDRVDETSDLYKKFKGKIAGIIGMRFNFYKDSQVWLCRKEVAKTIAWAGNPAKDTTDGLISPRKSFETWEEIVRNQSAAWSQAELFTIRHRLKEHLVNLFGMGEKTIESSYIDNNCISLIVTDPNLPGNPIIHVNRAFAELYGYKPDEVIGQNPRILHAGLIDEKTQKRFRKAIADRKPLSILVRNLTKSGDFLWIMNNIHPVFNDQGALIYYVGVQFNITAIKDDSTDSIWDHQLIEKSLNTQDKMLAICDGSRIQYVNQPFLDFFGYQSLQEFTDNHDNMQELFEVNELFFDTFHIGTAKNWIEAILKLPQDQRVIGMVSKKEETHSFNISVFRFDTRNYLISFTDTTSDMLQQIDLLKAATQDPLTGAYNRQYFYNHINRLISESSRLGKQLGVIMTDIDHFKQVNDTYGHPAGDDVLRAFVDMLSLSLRKDDWIIRWGGEEFLILTLVQDDEGIGIIAENLRQRVKQISAPPVERVSASFGATLMQRGETINEVISRADRAMYLSKKTGRDRVEIR